LRKGQALPIEIRKLVFTTAELQDVVVSHCLSGNIPLPDAEIEGIDVSNSPEATVTINFQAADAAPPSASRLTREQVATAIIRHPIPRQGQKLLQAQGGGLALMVKVEWQMQTTT
jgi:hypothetical protein